MKDNKKEKKLLRTWSSKYWAKNSALDTIKEAIDPNSIDTSSLQIHDILSPIIWENEDKMKPEIRLVLLKNAKEFIEFSDLEKLEFKDIILTGSLANYNYNENSDLDIHIILDFNQISENIDFVGDFLRMKKQLWSESLPIQIKGHDVELYFQNSTEPHQSSGIYSIIKDKWDVKPIKKIINLDTANIQLKAASFMNAIDDLETNKNKSNFLNKHRALKDKIKKYRQIGLDENGEYSIENLVFKILRNTGYLGKLAELKTDFLTKELSLNEFINEEVGRLLNEYDAGDIYAEKYTDSMQNIFSDFIYNNNTDFTKNIPWKVIPFSRLKKIWEDFMQYGVVRDESGVDYIEDIMIDNTIKINIITKLCGHTSSSPEEDYEDNIGYHVDEYLNNELRINNLKIYLDAHMNEQYYQYGYKPENIVDDITDEENQLDKSKIRDELYENLKDKFLNYYVEDPKSGHAYLSDYGLEPLNKNLWKLLNERNTEKKIAIMDRILNVVHQRSDIASWYVEGGSSSLSNLSGYETTDKPEEFNQYGSNVSNKQ